MQDLFLMTFDDATDYREIAKDYLVYRGYGAVHYTRNERREMIREWEVHLSLKPEFSGVAGMVATYDKMQNSFETLWINKWRIKRGVAVAKHPELPSIQIAADFTE
jgi:hypothetical protein